MTKVSQISYHYQKDSGKIDKMLSVKGNVIKFSNTSLLLCFINRNKSTCTDKERYNQSHRY